MIEGLPGAHRITVAADKAYDTRDFVTNLRDMHVTPHVAQSEARTGAARSMAARRGIPATPSASRNANRWSKASGG